jgi:hypothetical protein
MMPVYFFIASPVDLRIDQRQKPDKTGHFRTWYFSSLSPLGPDADERQKPGKTGHFRAFGHDGEAKNKRERRKSAPKSSRYPIGGSSMATLILDYEPPRDDPSRRIITRLESAVLAAAGILLPMLCFAASFNRYLGGPDYQRGNWSDYLTLIPSVIASWPFAPLLFAPTFAMAVLVIAPHRVAQSWLLRWALYSGAILSAQYTLIQAIAFTEPSSPLSIGTFVAIGAAAVTTLLSLGALWLVPRLPRIKMKYWLPCVILIPPAAVIGWHITLPIILVTVMLGAIVAPAITLAAYLRVSFIARKLAQHEPRAASPIRLSVPLVWLTTYGTAWAIAFTNAIDLYNALPKKPPDC